MKQEFILLVILVFTVSSFAQISLVNEEIPQIIISDITWLHKEDWKVWGADTYGTGDPMRPSTMKVQKRNYFIYRVSIKNETGRKLKAFSYDLVFLKKDDGKEASRLEFGYFLSFKKNKKIKTEIFSGPPNRLVDVKDVANYDPTTAYSVNAEIKCVMYEDNTFWQRKGRPENACNELIENVKKREEFLKGRVF